MPEIHAIEKNHILYPLKSIDNEAEVNPPWLSAIKTVPGRNLQLLNAL